jgi:hypothetical protein
MSGPPDIVVLEGLDGVRLRPLLFLGAPPRSDAAARTYFEACLSIPFCARSTSQIHVRRDRDHVVVECSCDSADLSRPGLVPNETLFVTLLSRVTHLGAPQLEGRAAASISYLPHFAVANAFSLRVRASLFDGATEHVSTFANGKFIDSATVAARTARQGCCLVLAPDPKMFDADHLAPSILERLCVNLPTDVPFSYGWNGADALFVGNL